jgi:hypothetical protein
VITQSRREERRPKAVDKRRAPRRTRARAPRSGSRREAPPKTRSVRNGRGARRARRSSSLSARARASARPATRNGSDVRACAHARVRASVSSASRKFLPRIAGNTAIEGAAGGVQGRGADAASPIEKITTYTNSKFVYDDPASDEADRQASPRARANESRSSPESG